MIDHDEISSAIALDAALQVAEHGRVSDEYLRGRVALLVRPLFRWREDEDVAFGTLMGAVYRCLLDHGWRKEGLSWRPK